MFNDHDLEYTYMYHHFLYTGSYYKNRIGISACHLRIFLPFLTEDSNEAPADVLKIAQMITGSLDDTATSEESRHHHRSKKKSKWRKKRKASKEKKDHQQSDTEKDSAQDRLKTVDKVLSEDSQNSSFVSSKNPLESDEPDSKRINQQKSETVEDKMSDKEDM